MTPEQIEAARSKAMGWSDANPFKARQLARLGGLHKASTFATDRTVIAEQPKVDHARATAEALSEPACDF